jgi:hypothetical protein
MIEAMQNAWRFVDDEVLRNRLKEAKGIGTPATRAEIIGGLKKQGFLIAQGKNIVPTETGLSLFGVLKQADPALVDPGVTAQLECLLDDVVLGKQEMVGAIDAVCDVAERIISKLKEGATAGVPSLLGSAGGNGTGTYPPTPAMKRFADSLVRQKGIKPPPGYKTSISICRKFLSEHAPKKSGGETAGKLDPKPVSPAQLVYAKKLAQGKGLIIPDDTRTNSAAMSAWINSNRGTKHRKSGRTTTYKPAEPIAPQSAAPPLARANEEHGQKMRRYWTNACKTCAIKDQCTTGKERRITRWEHEHVLETVQQRLDQDPQAMRRRRETVEHPFGTLKMRMGATHLLMKTLPKVASEMALSVLAYNLTRVMNIVGTRALLAAISA